MNLNQLKYIITVAEELNISQAAQKLFISQPSLSQSIQFLEKELGASIFERKPLRLTYAGEIFVDWAKKVLSTEFEMKQRIADINPQENIKITIGVAPYRSTYVLPPIISEFKCAHPHCNILIEEHSTDILKVMLDEEKIDLLIDTPHTDTFSYESIPVMRERILLGVPSSWQLNFEDDADFPVIDLALLKDKPFVLVTKFQLLGKIARNVCNQKGFIPNIVLECHNIETAYSMMMEGMGATFVPELYVKHAGASERIKIYKIKDAYPDREIALIYNKGRYLPRPADTFIKLLKTRLEKQ